MSFTSPLWLWGLLALPVVLFFEWRAVVRARRAVLALVGPRPEHPLLAQTRAWSRRLGLALRGAALALLLLGAAGPQWGRETVLRESRGSDVIFAIDVSASMEVRDVSPSRLDEARREALGLLERLGGSRVGVVLFAGEAARVCPLTLDHSAVRMVLENISSASLSEPGTNLAVALRQAVAALPEGRRDQQGIVLWTDGEDLEGQARTAIETAKRSGVPVFAVGVGTPNGDVIPVLDLEGRTVDVRKDENGNVVRSRLDAALLRDLARATRGGYFSASRPGGELQRLSAMAGTLVHVRRGARMTERPVARFGWCALVAALLLAADFARSRRMGAGAGAGEPVRTAAAAALLLAFALMAPPREAAAQSAWAKGDAAFRAGRWAQAESLYAKRAGRTAPGKLRVNLATARAMNGRGEAAERDLSHLSADSGAAGRAAGYNLGTVLGGRREYDRALGELRRALERDPADKDARWNYEMLLREKEKAAGQKQPQQQPQQPQSSPSQAGPSGPPPPTPQAGQGPGSPPPPAPSQRSPQQQPGPGGAPGMTRSQAEQLLGSLQELERIERQRSRRAQTMRQRKGKDW